MGAATAIVQRAYEAFSRGDVPGIVDLLADEVDWECHVPGSVAYSGKRRNREQAAEFFAALPQADDIHAFEPREYIEAGEHVTVLGWVQATALDTGKDFESEWLHLFTVKDGKITRWRGFFDSAARYQV